MSVTLRKGNKTKKGVSWYLDIYHEGKRKRQYLNLYGNDPETISLARRIRKNTEMQLAAGTHRVSSGLEGDSDMLEIHLWYDGKSDYKTYKAAMTHFKEFSKRDFYPCNMLTPEVAEKYKKYLQSKLQRETPYNYFKKFKRMIKDATRKGLFAVDPCLDVRNENPTRNDIKKEVLMLDEIQVLASTPCAHPLVKESFLFAVNAGGLRFCDVKDLTWKEVKLTERLIVFSQNKTGVQNFVPLNENAMDILVSLVRTSDKVFPGLQMDTINKHLQKWVKAAGIDKHITFGVARHSHASAIVELTGNIKVASQLLGHTTSRNTEKYLHILDAQRRKAVDMIPKYDSPTDKNNTGNLTGL